MPGYAERYVELLIKADDRNNKQTNIVGKK